MTREKRAELVDGFLDAAFENMHYHQKEMLRMMLNGLTIIPATPKRKIGFITHEETQNDR